MNNKTVTVIIPVFNDETHIAQAIDSVMQQGYEPLEVIVVDDGSDDKTAEIVKSFPLVKYIHQENAGVSAARNTGISQANGEYIAFLDSDDKWLPLKLKKQTEIMEKNERIDLTITKMRVELESGMEWPAWLNEEHYRQDPVGYLPSTLLARKSAFEQIGIFNEKFKHSEDADWFFRAKDAGLQIKIIDEVLLLRLIHPQNRSHALQNETKDFFNMIRQSVQRKKLNNGG
ncbi:glycosyltransferase family 2 protein [Candidatus Neomarinimicrobiota bacterium]